MFIILHFAKIIYYKKKNILSRFATSYVIIILIITNIFNWTIFEIIGV